LFPPLGFPANIGEMRIAPAVKLDAAKLTECSHKIDKEFIADVFP
jgi:hypothetical protein